MAKEKGATIVIKKVHGGHAAAHGGAWKVAYADFVTAMMAFFLVMWLMGSDEETKASVSSYFNNPTSAWRTDLASKDSVPLGDMTGAGEDIVNGASGAMPDDLVERPTAVSKSKTEAVGAGAIDELLNSKGLLKLQEVRFSVDSNAVFKEGSTHEWRPEVESLMKSLSQVSKSYKGSLVIQTQYQTKQGLSEESPGSYEFQLSRAIAIEKYMVSHDLIDQDKVTTKVSKAPASDSEVNSRIDFLLSR